MRDLVVMSALLSSYWVTFIVSAVSLTNRFSVLCTAKEKRSVIYLFVPKVLPETDIR